MVEMSICRYSLSQARLSMSLTVRAFGRWFSRNHPTLPFLLSHLWSLPDPWGHWVCDSCLQHCPLFSTQCCCLFRILFSPLPASRSILARNDFHDLWPPQGPCASGGKRYLPIMTRAQFFWIIVLRIIHWLASTSPYLIILRRGLTCILF